MASISSTSVGKHHKNNRGGLIEDWPHNSKLAQDPCKSSKKKISTGKRVRFSASASCRVYIVDSSYETNKSYTKANQKDFGRSAMTEVVRIRRALATLPNSAELTQIESLGITREEILGLEHLALTSSPSAILEIRRRHLHNILLEQEKKMMMSCGVDSMLARLSALTSRESVEQARIRARQ